MNILSCFEKYLWSHLDSSYSRVYVVAVFTIHKGQIYTNTFMWVNVEVVRCVNVE